MIKHESKEDHLECTRCPVCLDNHELQALLRHDCQEAHAVVLVAPKTKCSFCNYVTPVYCKCAICNVAKHTQHFKICPDPWPENPYPKLPQFANVESEYELNQRAKYLKSEQEGEKLGQLQASFCINRTSLIHLLAEPDGYVVLYEIEREAPGFLDRVGATDSIKARVYQVSVLSCVHHKVDVNI